MSKKEKQLEDLLENAEEHDGQDAAASATTPEATTETASEPTSIKMKGDHNVGQVHIGNVNFHGGQGDDHHFLESLVYIAKKQKQKYDPMEDTLDFIREDVREKLKSEERRKGERREERPDFLDDGEKILAEELKRHHLEKNINSEQRHDFAAVAWHEALNAFRHHYQAQIKMVKFSAKLFVEILESEV